MRIELCGDAVADRDDGLHIVLAQAIDLPHAETQREASHSSFLVMLAKAGIQ